MALGGLAGAFGLGAPPIRSGEIHAPRRWRPTVNRRGARNPSSILHSRVARVLRSCCPGGSDGSLSRKELGMRRREFMSALAGIIVVGTPLIADAQAPPGPAQRGAGGRWDQDAEESFRLGHGLGPRLMTEDEWREHQQKMRTMTAEERERYRTEMHQRMMERAKERGVEPRPMPRSGSPGGGPGSSGGAGKPGR